MVAIARAAGIALLLAAATLAPADGAAARRRGAPSPVAGAEQAPRFDAHRPGRSLHGRVFHVPQGARLTWEAWEGARGGRIAAVHLEDESLIDLERSGVDTPADRLGAGLALVRYVLTVSAAAPPDAVLGVKVAGGATGPSGVEEAHDWDFAFTIHVVRGDRYASEPTPGPV